MQPHELVDTLHKRQDLEKREKHLDDEEELLVGALLDKCSDIADRLATGKFCENEFGHIEFTAKSFDNSAFGRLARVSDTVEIVCLDFVGADGSSERLGQIGRKVSYGQGKESRGWVDAWITLGGERPFDIEMDSEPLTPEDPRWEAVFKPFEIAVMQLTEEQS